MRQLE